MELEIGEDSVIDFHVWGGKSDPVPAFRVLRSEVDLPVPVLHGFGIVREERRTRPDRKGDGQQKDAQEGTGAYKAGHGIVFRRRTRVDKSFRMKYPIDKGCRCPCKTSAHGSRMCPEPGQRVKYQFFQWGTLFLTLEYSKISLS